ncbi:MAG: hypothetical protein R3E39_18495 [Anaerolineae bacterium]
MTITIPPLVIMAASFLTVGGLWMLLYWRFVEPAVRRGIGTLIGAAVLRGDQGIWVVQDEAEDSLNWRTMLIRPLQMVCLFGSMMVALVFALAITVKLSS